MSLTQKHTHTQISNSIFSLFLPLQRNPVWFWWQHDMEKSDSPVCKLHYSSESILKQQPIMVIVEAP